MDIISRFLEKIGLNLGSFVKRSGTLLTIGLLAQQVNEAKNLIEERKMGGNLYMDISRNILNSFPKG